MLIRYFQSKIDLQLLITQLQHLSIFCSLASIIHSTDVCLFVCFVKNFETNPSVHIISSKTSVCISYRNILWQEDFILQRGSPLGYLCDWRRVCYKDITDIYKSMLLLYTNPQDKIPSGLGLGKTQSQQNPENSVHNYYFFHTRCARSSETTPKTNYGTCLHTTVWRFVLPSFPTLICPSPCSFLFLIYFKSVLPYCICVSLSAEMCWWMIHNWFSEKMHIHR